MITWKVEIDGATEIIRDFEGLDEALKNKTFTNALWKNVFEQISVFIKKRFEEGKSNWKPLTPMYRKWKTRAVSKGYKVKVGSFGKRVCKLNELGRLTNTMYTSATEREKDANIFEVDKIANGVQFRYAISGSKLPYAKFFNNKREFFFITEEEAEQVFQIMEKAVETNI